MKVKPPTQLNCTSVSSLFKLRLRSPAQCQIEAPRLCATTTRQPRRGKGLRSAASTTPVITSLTLLHQQDAHPDQHSPVHRILHLCRPDDGGLLRHWRKNSPGLGGNPAKCFSSLSSRSDCVRVQHPPTHAALHEVLLLLPARYWRQG